MPIRRVKIDDDPPKKGGHTPSGNAPKNAKPPKRPDDSVRTVLPPKVIMYADLLREVEREGKLNNATAEQYERKDKNV